ncbi:MAG: hypothetical protein K5644_01890 [Lachnospiraceae bacterium]|nr:hypothetical protein [Lachnospiraceae bacterium]
MKKIDDEIENTQDNERTHTENQIKISDDDEMIGCYKASLTVEASFVMIITMAVLLALFLLMFIVYQENVDFINDKMRDYSFDSVTAFRFSQVIRSFGK